MNKLIGLVVIVGFVYWSLQQPNKSASASNEHEIEYSSNLIETTIANTVVSKPPQCHDNNPWIKLPDNAYNIYYRPDWIKFEVKGITYYLNVHTGEYLHYKP